MTVIAAADAEQAERRLARHDAGLTLDRHPGRPAPATRASPSSPPSCRRSAPTEVHLALPATISAAAADELHGALAPLGITHVALTHADATARPGAPIEVAMTTRTAAVLRLRPRRSRARGARRALARACSPETAPAMAVSAPPPPALDAGKKVSVRLPYVGSVPGTVEAVRGDTVHRDRSPCATCAPSACSAHEGAIEVASPRGHPALAGAASTRSRDGRRAA